MTCERIRNGMVQTVLVKYDRRGRSTVTPLGHWRPITNADKQRWYQNALKALRRTT